MCLPVCPKALLGPFGAPSTPHLPVGDPSSPNVPFRALSTPWLGFSCLQMPSVWLSDGHWFAFWWAPELSVSLLVHLKILGCFWGAPQPPWDFQKASDSSACCPRTGQVAKHFF